VAAADVAALSRRVRTAALLALTCTATLLSAGGAAAAGGWTTMGSKLTTPRSSFGLAAAPCPAGGQCLFAVGGFSNASTNIATAEAESEGSPAPAWAQLPQALVAGRAYLDSVAGPCPGTSGLATARQCVYAIGGASYGGSQIALRSVEYLDPHARLPAWRTLPAALATPRAALSATTGPCPASTGFATAPQCVYAIGGADIDVGRDALQSVEYFDPSMPGAGWRTLGSGLQLGRSALGAATAPCPGTTGLPGASLCLYAIGGFNAAVGYLGSVEYLDPSTPSPGWRQMPGSLEIPRAALGASTGPCPGTSGLASASRCIYAVAGTLGSYLASVEVEDPAATVPSWRLLPDALSTPRGSLRTAVAACPAGGRLASGSQCVFAAGGATQDPFFEFLDTVELLDPSGAVAPGTTVSLSKATASPGLARSLAGTGFAPGEQVDARWNGIGGPALGHATADSSGALEALAFRVPSSPAGDYGVYVTGETSGKAAFALLRVVPALRVLPVTGAPGSAIAITGRGYGAHDLVTVRWGCDVEPESRCAGAVLATATTDADGAFSASASIPAGASPGPVEIGGKGSDPGVYADAGYTVSG
jgi:hypothetical protein